MMNFLCLEALYDMLAQIFLITFQVCLRTLYNMLVQLEISNFLYSWKVTAIILFSSE